MEKDVAGCRKFLLLAFSVFFAVPALHPANAGDVNFGGPGMPADRPASSGSPGAWGAKACDEDYMNVLRSQAWLAGQYETLVNQSIILKPDSVFEYSCFFEPIGYTSSAIAPIFSESQEFEEITIDIGTMRGPRIINTGFAREQGSMEEALLKSVLYPLDHYLKNNYEHTLLGGTSALPGQPCQPMSLVWHLAKCTNFHPPWLEEAGRGNLYEIEDFIELDPRLYPEECNNSQVSEWIIDASNNEDLAYHSVSKPFTFEEYRNASCASPPVPVGLEYTKEVPELSGELVIGQEVLEYAEYVCPNQGCHYDPEAGECVP